jgi:hypothetical protein
MHRPTVMAFGLFKTYDFLIQKAVNRYNESTTRVVKESIKRGSLYYF